MKLNFSEIEFSKVKQNIINFLKTNQTFKDLNYEASGINQVIDALALTICHLNYYQNMSVNEAFLTSSILRSNIIAHAKGLNYRPRRISGAVGNIDISLKTTETPADPSTVIYIPLYTKFLAGGYDFYTVNSYELTSANSYTMENISLKQGLRREYTETSTGAVQHSITLTDDNIDEEYLQVLVDDEVWTLETDYVVVDEDSEIYSLELTEDGAPKIIFGDGVLGKIPPVGAEIKVTYSTTAGPDANGYKVFSMNQVIEDNYTGTYDNSMFNYTVNQISLGGAWEESNASIIRNSPKFRQSQGNLITKSNYESYLLRHQLVEDVYVYGGEEDAINPIYGRVFISVKPPNQRNLTPEQKVTLQSYIDSLNVLTIKPEFKDIQYIGIDISGTIYYSQLFESQLNTVKSTTQSAINSFFSNHDKFNNILKEALLISNLIDLEEIENVNITLQPWFNFHKVGTGNYKWFTGNPIVPGSVSCVIMNGIIDEGFHDDGLGNIISVDGVIGEVDYSTGEIEIYPGYSIVLAEPTANGFKVLFDTQNRDIKFILNNSIELGSLSLLYTRYV